MLKHVLLKYLIKTSHNRTRAAINKRYIVPTSVRANYHLINRDVRNFTCACETIKMKDGSRGKRINNSTTVLTSCKLPIVRGVDETIKMKLDGSIFPVGCCSEKNVKSLHPLKWLNCDLLYYNSLKLQLHKIIPKNTVQNNNISKLFIIKTMLHWERKPDREMRKQDSLELFLSTVARHKGTKMNLVFNSYICHYTQESSERYFAVFVSLQKGVIFWRILGEQMRKRGEREARFFFFSALFPSRATRASRSPRFRLCSPKIR